MKIFLLIMSVILLGGCSSYHTSLKTFKAKSSFVKHPPKTYIEDKRANTTKKSMMHTENTSKSTIFKSTLSSFVPAKEMNSYTDVSWAQLIQDYTMSTNFILYMLSFIMIGWIIFIGIKYKKKYKKTSV